VLDSLGEALRALRRGPDPRPHYDALGPLLGLDSAGARRLTARLSRSINPGWSLLHFLLSYVGSPDGGAISELAVGLPFDPRRQADPIGTLLQTLGLPARVIDRVLDDAVFQAFGRTLAGPEAPVDPGLAARWAERFEHRARPSGETLRKLSCIMGDNTPAWLQRTLTDLDALEQMAKGEAPLRPTRAQLETCLALVERGWSVGTPTALLGLECTASPGWFREVALVGLSTLVGWTEFPARLAAARSAGQSARLRDLLELDRWSPAPAWTSPLDPRRNELCYALTAAGYWWMAGRPDFAESQRQKAQALAELYGLDPNLLPTDSWASFDAVADGLAIPADPRDDRLYWWMGQPEAHLQLAELLASRSYGAHFRALHVGSADGSQTLFMAAALDRAIGDGPTQLEIHGLDAGWIPPIDQGSMELDQSHPAYASSWPVLAEELLDDGHTNGVAFRLRQLLSGIGLLAPTDESLPFRKLALGRGPRYQRLPSRWQLQAPGARSLRFFRANLFEADAFPNTGYGLLVLTHVLPWIRMYETGPVQATQAELLERTMAILRPVLVPGALVILDPLSLLEHEGKEWRLYEKDPSEGVAYDYRGRRMIDLSPLDGFEVKVVEPEAGLITPEQLRAKLPS
jgi:hypothetical protein